MTGADHYDDEFVRVGGEWKFQRRRITLYFIWFDHNALYHLIQAVALLLLFLAARGLTEHEGV